MTAALRLLTRQRSDNRCEYCRLVSDESLMSFHIEHIIPRQHGGLTTEANLALACPHCNLHKGTNLTGIDPDSQEVTRLFHPRRDVWDDHFRIEQGRITGKSVIGRTTVWLLKMNDPYQVTLRLPI